MSAQPNPDITCEVNVPGDCPCGEAVTVRKWMMCNRHAYSQRKYNDPLRAKSKPRLGWPDNLLTKLVECDDGCIRFTKLTYLGYGQPVRMPDGRDIAPHVAAYELFVGPIPDGKELDHICHDPDVCQLGDYCPHRACCNVDHLEPVDRDENMRRARRSTCRNGHALTPDNVYVSRLKNGRIRRSCVICHKAGMDRYEQRKREGLV